MSAEGWHSVWIETLVEQLAPGALNILSVRANAKKITCPSHLDLDDSPFIGGAGIYVVTTTTKTTKLRMIPLHSLQHYH